MAKEEPKIIGRIGSTNVVDINGFVCLQILGRRAIGITKIKAVLANDAVCRQFLAQYDVAKAPAAAAVPVPTTPAEVAQQVANLQALLAKMTAPAPVPASV